MGIESIDARVLFLEGDGVGPEETVEAIKVLNASCEIHNHKIEIIKAPFGAQSYFDSKRSYPDKTRELALAADAVVKGPVGLAVAEMNRIPIDERPEKAGLLPLRKDLDVYVNMRPAFLPAALVDFSCLKNHLIPNGLNLRFFRELVGGLYFGPKVEWQETDGKYAKDDSTYTDEQVIRFAHECCKQAEKLDGRVYVLHKSNVEAASRIFEKLFFEVASGYQNVTPIGMLVDNAAYQLLKNPSQFNDAVIAMRNKDGDLLTDEAGGLVGSLGKMYSVSYNPETGKTLYEPAHGSAPDIAGEGKVNPYSLIGCMGLLFEYSFGRPEEGRQILTAMDEVYMRNYMTVDLADEKTPKDRILTTSQFGDMVVDIMRGN